MRAYAPRWHYSKPRTVHSQNRRLLTAVVACCCMACQSDTKYKALRSACGFGRPLRSLPRNNWTKCECMKVDRQRGPWSEMLSGDLRINANSPKIHGNNPDAAWHCMDEVERAERKSSVQATSHQLSCSFVNAYLRRPGRIRFLRSLWEHSELYKIIDMLARANCLLACAPWSVRTCFTACCAGWLRCAVLCCAVLCCAVLAEQRKHRNWGRFSKEYFFHRQLQADNGWVVGEYAEHVLRSRRDL